NSPWHFSCWRSASLRLCVRSGDGCSGSSGSSMALSAACSSISSSFGKSSVECNERNTCMNAATTARDSILRNVHVLDGGMASELEYLGANINGPLWSAPVLEDAPEIIVAVHRAFNEAGADCLETASYQVSRMGYVD